MFEQGEGDDHQHLRTFSTPESLNFSNKTITTTETGIRDIEVTFTSDSPALTYTRHVNVCFAADGTTYDDDATNARIVQVGDGVAHKIAVGVIS